MELLSFCAFPVGRSNRGEDAPSQTKICALHFIAAPLWHLRSLKNPLEATGVYYEQFFVRRSHLYIDALRGIIKTAFHLLKICRNKSVREKSDFRSNLWPHFYWNKACFDACVVRDATIKSASHCIALYFRRRQPNTKKDVRH